MSQSQDSPDGMGPKGVGTKSAYALKVTAEGKEAEK
jgi:hypothetical protein